VKIILKYGLLSLSFLIVNLICGSCIPLYVPKPTRGLVDTSNVKPGVTSKEQILLEFGGVFNVSNDGKLFTLTYNKEGDFSWIGPNLLGGPPMEIGKKHILNSYTLEIEFDENDIVNRCETFELPRTQSQSGQTIENK